MANFIKDSYSKNHHALIISRDGKSAFNAAWWPAILPQFCFLFLCPKNLYFLSVNYFFGCSASTSTETHFLCKDVTMSCPQGSCNGP